MRAAPALFLALALATAAEAVGEPVVREAKVSSESRNGKAWTTMSGRIEALTDLSPAQLAAVITDWASYPRLFPQLRKVEAVADGGAVLLSETMVISALGFEVTKRLTLRMRVTEGPEPGRWSLVWTQEASDGTIDGTEGGWDLVPATVNGKAGTKVLYRAASAVPQSIPGQDGIVGLFYPGELKQIVNAVLIEARKKKEKP